MTGYWGYRPLEDFTRVQRQNLIEMLALSGVFLFLFFSFFRRVLQPLDFQPLTELFNTWAANVIALTPQERLAIDGKSIRCTVCDYSQSYQNFLSIVSVFSHQRGIVVRTQPLANKETSELTVVQELISEFSGQQVMFTLDALHCQKKPYP